MVHLSISALVDYLSISGARLVVHLPISGALVELVISGALVDKWCTCR